MGTTVDRESMENGTRGRLFTRRVPGIVAEECSSGREFVETLCKFSNRYVQLKKLAEVVVFCSSCYHGATCSF